MNHKAVCVVVVLAAIISARADEKKPEAAPAGLVELGKHIIEKKKCSICHAIDGKGGKTGKPMNGITVGKTDEQLKAAMLDPKKTIGPDTKMPVYKFTDDEVAAVIAYMKSLKPVEKPKS